MAAPLAGYSGTPLVRKLGINPGLAFAVADAPPGFDAALGALPEGARRIADAEGAVDVLIAFHRSRRDLEASFLWQARRVVASGSYWVAWPKRSSGVPTDLTEGALREVVLPSGMVDVKVCAIDATWSGLRFVVRKGRRADWPPLS